MQETNFLEKIAFQNLQSLSMGAWLVSKVRVFLFLHGKENLKGEKYIENIHENYVPNVKDHVVSTFVTK